MTRSWWVLTLVVVAGLLGCLVLSGSCSEPQQAEEDEFPPPNDPVPT